MTAETKPEAETPETVVEESTTFTCKKCGKKNCRIGKYKDSPRIKLEWCSDCGYELEYQEWRLDPLVKRIQKYMKDIKPFPELKSRFVKDVTKALKA